jgi:predicted transposase YdaD
MPITDDIMDHDLLGPAIRQGIQQGREEGRQEGELKAIRRLAIKRFGTIPGWADERLEALSLPEIENLYNRILDAKNIEDLFTL